MKHDSDILKRIKTYFMRRKSADEAYAFEREMERDAFLYEAMEGFEDMLSSDIQQAMDELDDRVDARLKNSFQFQWRYAAGIALLIAAGFAVYWISFTTSPTGDLPQGEMAGEEATPTDARYVPRVVDPVFESLEDTDSDSYAFEMNSTPAEDVGNAAMPNSTPPGEVEVREEAIVQKTVVPNAVPAKELDLAETAQRDADLPPVKKLNEEVQSTEMAQQDALENESFSDSQTFTLQEAQQKVAVSTPSSAEISSKVDKTSVSGTPASAGAAALPKGGMPAFHQYVSANIRKSDGMPNGQVVLSFELDKDGSPKKVKVVKSLCTACDAEAIRLLENGPKWTSEDKKATGTVSITF